MVPEPVTRDETDRLRRISLSLGGRHSAGAYRLADEVVRLHRVLEAVLDALMEDRQEAALDLITAEVAPEWGARYLDERPPEFDPRRPSLGTILTAAYLVGG